MRSSTFQLETRDGVPIHTYRWLPDGESRAVIQIVHGIAEHAGRYEHVAERLTAEGYAVYADDHRGHGRTAVTEEDLGFFAQQRGWATVLDDLHRLNRAAHAENPGVPMFLLGHSMGSLLVQQYLFTFPESINGAVLSGSTRHRTAVVEAGAALARVELARLGPRGRSPALELAAFGMHNRAFRPTRTAFDWLSRDPTAVDAYVADPACGFLSTTRLWLDLCSGLRVIGQQQRLLAIPPRLPLYLFSGDADPVGESGAGVHRLVRAYERAGMQDLEVRLYEGGRHEMLNEVNREQVLDDLTTWLEQRRNAVRHR